MRKRQVRWKLVWLEPAKLCQVIGGCFQASNGFAEIVKVERVVAASVRVDLDRQQLDESDLEAGFLAHLAASGIRRQLPWIEKPAGDVPAPARGLHGAAPEQDASIAQHQRASARLGVAVVHCAARGARLREQPFALRLRWRQRRPAIGAEAEDIHARSRGYAAGGTLLAMRFLVEVALGTAAALMFIVTLVWNDWIEMAFRVEPDAGDGNLERAICILLIAIALGSAWFARTEWRRMRNVAATNVLR